MIYNPPCSNFLNDKVIRHWVGEGTTMYFVFKNYPTWGQYGCGKAMTTNLIYLYSWLQKHLV